MLLTLYGHANINTHTLTCALINNSKKSSSVVGCTNVDEPTDDGADDVDVSDTVDEVAELVLQ